MPRWPENIQWLWEYVVVDKTRINWEQSHQKDDIATSKNDAKYLQQIAENNKLVSRQKMLKILN